jgi:hypothetical protein
VKLFRKVLSKVLEEFRAKFSRLNKHKPVSADEDISRYIFSSKHFNSKGTKHAAFMPRNGETSVFCISSISEGEIWDIGENHVGQNMEPSLKGRADLKCREVQNIGLDVVHETSTHALHANITNWPSSRDEILELAIDLANQSTFYKKPT